MKKILFSLLLAMMAISGAAHAITKADAEAKCRAYAQEDGISPEEMKDYIAQCIDDLMQAEGDEKSTGSSD